MPWPFVLRSRFDDRERRINELLQEIKDLKYAHARVVDEINFRSTGFHIDERFAAKEEAAPIGALPSEPEVPKTGVAAAIERVGTRPTAIRNFLEMQGVSGQQEQERKELEGAEIRKKEALRLRLEEALQNGSKKAAQIAQA